MPNLLVASAKSLWTRLSNNGAEGLDYASARRVVLSNQFCIIAIGLNLIYALQVMLLNTEDLSVLLLLIMFACLAFLTSMSLNSTHQFRLARWILSSVPVATLLLSAYFIGNGAGLQLYLIVIWTLLFLIYTRQEIRTLFLFSMVYWLGFLLIEYRFTEPALGFHFPPDVMAQVYGLSITGTFVAVALVVGLFFAEIHRAERRLQEEYERSERLLKNILPSSIADRLKQQPAMRDNENGNRLIADSVPEATVLFADIVGFTPLSGEMQPDALVRLLNEVFSHFDDIVMRHGLEKIKTIGDAYMLVGGLPDPREGACKAVALASLEMIQALDAVNSKNQFDLELRIGIHCGPLTAGVIGQHKFAYDIWGDTVNIASRLESHGLPGRIQVSKSVFDHLHPEFAFETRGEIEIKGRGRMKTWLLINQKEAECQNRQAG